SGLTNGVNGNLVGVANPSLGALANNGGPTQTMALLFGSPAIGAGDPVLAGTLDQRGVTRNAPVRIGAFQSPGPLDETPSLIAQVTALVSAGVLNSGNGNGLIAKLTAATASLNKGNITAADNQMNAFINQVNAFVNSGKLTSAESQPL